MKYLYWDIDGTLLLTNFAGVGALKAAIKEIYGVEDFTFTQSLGGRTDNFIASEAICSLKGSATKAEVANLLRVYTEFLPAFLTQNKGHLLKNVAALLAALSAEEEVTSLLLTGNCAPGAKAKVAHFGLEAYFDFELSAFGEISALRNDLALAAWQKLTAKDPAVKANDVLVIGDTPHDITCAQAINAPSLIVMDGSTFTKDELTSYHPWKIIDELPSDASLFLDLINNKE